MAQQAFAWEILVFPRENHFWNFESQWQAEQSICKNEAGGFYFEMKNQKKKMKLAANASEFRTDHDIFYSHEFILGLGYSGA